MNSQLKRIKKLELMSEDEKPGLTFFRNKELADKNKIMDYKDFKKAYRKFKRKMKWNNN